MEIKSFSSKTALFNYIIKKYPKSSLILLSGSMVSKPVKDYSDFDLEVHMPKGELKRPYYELVFVSNKLCLITIYFCKLRTGKKINPPKDKKVIWGEYNTGYRPSGFNTYTPKQRTKRECQMVIDLLFKYLRHKEKKWLLHVAKRI